MTNEEKTILARILNDAIFEHPESESTVNEIVKKIREQILNTDGQSKVA